MTILLTAVLAGGTFLVAQQNVAAAEESIGLAERIAQRFGLNRTEVEEEFVQYRQKHQFQRGGPVKGDLDQAVVDGAITAEQKSALEAKWTERQSEREAHREEMQQWMEEQGIDYQQLREYRGMKGGCHGGRLLE